MQGMRDKLLNESSAAVMVAAEAANSSCANVVFIEVQCRGLLRGHAPVHEAVTALFSQ